MTRRKAISKKAMRKGETAWVEKHSKWEDRIKFKYKLTYLDFVRYMRWYTLDSRSYLQRKIDPPRPFEQPKHYQHCPLYKG